MQHTADIWLAVQQRRLGGAGHAALLATAEDGAALTPLASLPGPEVPAALGAASRIALSQRRAVLRAGQGSLDGDGAARDVIASPVLVGGRLVGAVAIEVQAASAEHQRRAAQTLHDGCAWLEALQRAETAALTGRLATVLEVIAAALEHEAWRASASAVVTELAGHLSCQRVSLGLGAAPRVRVVAMSHTATLAANSSLAGDLAACMQESLARGDSIAWEQDTTTRDDEDNPAHAALGARDGALAVLSVPLPEGNGALTLERLEGVRFDAAERETVEAALALFAPLLDLKRDSQRSLPARLGAGLAAASRALLGAEHLLAKSIMALALAAGLAGAFVTVDFEIAAPARLEGSVQRAVVTAQAGFVATASVRAGDVVEAGQLMASLDDRDLQLEHRKWNGRAAQLVKEHRDALASHDRAQVAILASQIEQAHAEIALLDEQLARTRLLAPIGGLVLSGDLSQSLGAPVERGELLFEVAPLAGYRVVLEVDERDIAHLKAGQHGQIALTSRPGKPLDLVVQRITPVAETTEGRHHFRVEAALVAAQESLRPGMQGVAKVLVDERSVGWVWSRRLVDWVRLQLWRWTP